MENFSWAKLDNRCMYENTAMEVISEFTVEQMEIICEYYENHHVNIKEAVKKMDLHDAIKLAIEGHKFLDKYEESGMFPMSEYNEETNHWTYGLDECLQAYEFFYLELTNRLMI